MSLYEKKTVNKKLIAIIAVVLAIVIAVSVVLVVKNKSTKEEETTTETKTIVSEIGATTLNTEEKTTDKQSVTEKQKVLNTDYALYIKNKKIFLSAYPSGETVQLTKSDFEDSDYFTCIAEKQEKIFYLDEIDEENPNTIGNLYYRDLKNLSKPPVKLAENVSSYYLLDDETLAYYVGKNLEKTLYWTDLNKTEKIGDKVNDFKYSEKNKTFFYSDGALYCKRLGGKSEKLHDDVWSFKLLDNDESCYFYVSEGNSSLTIYKKTVGEDPVKIDSGVDSEEFMYREVFCADGCGYYSKGEELYYYNGKISKLISETGMKRSATNEITAILYTESSKVYVALGDEIFDVTRIVGEDRDGFAYDLKVRKDGEIYVFNIKKVNYDTGKAELYTCPYDIENGRLVKYGLLLDDIYAYHDFALGGEKYFLSCKNLKDDLSDDGTHNQWSAIPARTGDLYLAGELISKAVNIYRVHFDEKTQTVCYFTDWNTSTRSGTLKIYNGGKEKVLAKNVSFFQFTDSGNVIYLKESTLYIYSNGKTTELEKSVDSLPSYYHSHCCVSFM